MPTPALGRRTPARTYELTAQGDTLAGREHVRTDVLHDRTPPERIVAVRTASCQVQPPRDTSTQRSR